MPYYEYECVECGKIEVEQKITDSILEKCPICASKITKLISSNTSFQLKGSGWYKDGYSKTKKID